MTDADSRPDRRLGIAIVRAQAGEVNALHFLYVRYADDICGYVNSIIRDPHDAEDVTQNVLRDRGHEHVGSDRLRSLRVAFDRLPEEQREVMVLRHIAGLSPCEIAAVLDKTESSVHGRHHRARVAVKDALSELGAAPVTAVS
jgi:RNA polymerase sigma-70 factor (ECF subfamily)